VLAAAVIELGPRVRTMAGATSRTQAKQLETNSSTCTCMFQLHLQCVKACFATMCESKGACSAFRAAEKRYQLRQDVVTRPA
jgi:hypothetical protein